MGDFFSVGRKNDGQRLDSDFAQFDVTSLPGHDGKTVPLENFLDVPRGVQLRHCPVAQR